MFKHEFLLRKTSNRNTVSTKYFILIGQYWSIIMEIILESFMTVMGCSCRFLSFILNLSPLNFDNTLKFYNWLIKYNQYDLTLFLKIQLLHYVFALLHIFFFFFFFTNYNNFLSEKYRAQGCTTFK